MGERLVDVVRERGRIDHAVDQVASPGDRHVEVDTDPDLAGVLVGGVELRVGPDGGGTAGGDDLAGGVLHVEIVPALSPIAGLQVGGAAGGDN